MSDPVITVKIHMSELDLLCRAAESASGTMVFNQDDVAKLLAIAHNLREQAHD